MGSLDFRKLARQYESELVDRVIPWWMDHAVDFKDGGMLYDLRLDGTVLSGEKSMWSQARALYTWSALYNRVGNRYEWLDLADHIYTFVLGIGRDSRWEWPEAVHKDGRIKEGPGRIYADGFAIMGMTEYATATGEDDAVDAALKTYDALQERMDEPGPHLDVPPELLPTAKCHGISMIFSMVFHELGRYLNNPEIMQAGYDHALQILDEFRRPDREVLLEYIGTDGKELDAPQGRLVRPGHAIESMWFLLHIFGDRRERSRADQAVECLRWHLEKGWDARYGGMFQTLDADGKPTEPDAEKCLWPHNEALVALLMAYEHSREPWCLEWFDKVHQWTFAHFRVPECGEWREKVQRDGRAPAEAERVHTAFHLPRSLMLCLESLERLSK